MPRRLWKGSFPSPGNYLAPSPPTLTPCAAKREAKREANSLLHQARMRRGGTASRQALPRRPTLQLPKKMEEEEHVEEREDKEAEDGCGPLLGALVID